MNSMGSRETRKASISLPVHPRSYFSQRLDLYTGSKFFSSYEDLSSEPVSSNEPAAVLPQRSPALRICAGRILPAIGPPADRPRIGVRGKPRPMRSLVVDAGRSVFLPRHGSLQKMRSYLRRLPLPERVVNKGWKSIAGRFEFSASGGLQGITPYFSHEQVSEEERKPFRAVKTCNPCCYWSGTRDPSTHRIPRCHTPSRDTGQA